MSSEFHATTIFAVRHKGECAMSGDGQVTLGNQVVMKHKAKKVRRIFKGQVLAGFAGSVADTLRFLKNSRGSLKHITATLPELQWN